MGGNAVKRLGALAVATLVLVIGQATAPGAVHPVEYTLLPGQPAWERPPATR